MLEIKKEKKEKERKRKRKRHGFWPEVLLLGGKAHRCVCRSQETVAKAFQGEETA